MFYSAPAVKTARKNIKLLSSADKLAIKKIKNEKYKTVLGKQERQLNHYLSTYTNPDYLPQSITKEYEFPKYFYYTVNKRDGTVVQKRARVDSKTFKNFMKNPEKRRQAKEQGLYNITDKPININFDIPAPTPKFKKPKSINDILGNVNFDNNPNQKKIYARDRRYEDTGPSIIQYSEKLSPAIILPFEGEELIEAIPSYTPIKKNIDIKTKKESTPAKKEPAAKKAAPAQKVAKLEDMTKKDIPKYWGRPNDAIILLKHFYPDAYRNLEKKAYDLYNKRKSINIPQMYTFLPTELNGEIFKYYLDTAWDEYIDILRDMTEDMEKIIDVILGTILYTHADIYDELRNNPSYFIQLTKYIPKRLLKKDKIYDLTHYKYIEEDEE